MDTAQQALLAKWIHDAADGLLGDGKMRGELFHRGRTHLAHHFQDLGLSSVCHRSVSKARVSELAQVVRPMFI